MEKETKRRSSKMILEVNEKPSVPKWIVLALQHVFAMFGATVLVPILVNEAAGAEVLTIPVALFASGLGTLIYLLSTKGKSPVYLGGSFAFIVPVALAYKSGGIAAAFTGIMIIGIIYMMLAFIIKKIGKKWIDKLLPPIVIGPMIMIIGLGLAPAAVSQIGLTGEITNWDGIIVATVSFLTTGLFSIRGKGFLKIIPVLIGIITGYITSLLLGMVDFTPVAESAWIGMPAFKIPFIDYDPSFVALLTIVPIGVVTLAEHIGEHAVLGNIIDKDLLKDPGLDRTILGDGAATFISGMLGNSDTTTYGENVSVVGMTKVASVWVIGLAGIFAMLLSFFSKFTVLISTIPTPVLGGISVILFGFIACNGIRVLVQNNIDFGNMRNVVIASTMLVLGLGGALITIINKDATISISSMSLAAMVGVVLNLILPKETE